MSRWKWLWALLAGSVCAAPEEWAAGGVETVEKDSVRYLVFRVKPEDLGRLELRWRDGRGRPLENFEGLRRFLAAQGREIEFATNAGIYERGPKPCGLTICQGRQEVPLNLAAGEGNFYLKPNGVFYVGTDGRAGVLEAAEYAQSGLKPRLATQSGPLLLRGGVIHPVFNQKSQNLRQRSGVGVRGEDGQVIFVMTDRRDPAKRVVSFHAFATFFLELGCQNALFLDGDLSDFAVNVKPDTVFRPQTYAGMLVLERKAGQQPVTPGR